MSYGAKQYKNTSVTTASPGQILIMLYEAAIRNLKKAVMAIEKGDLNAKGIAIGKTHDIINELNTSLNHEVGGQISRDLEALYNFCVQKLLEANLRNEKKHLEDIQVILANLLEGWRGAVAQTAKANATTNVNVKK